MLLLFWAMAFGAATHLIQTTGGSRAARTLAPPQTQPPPADGRNQCQHIWLADGHCSACGQWSNAIFTLKGVGRKYMGTVRTAPKPVCRLRLNSWLMGRVLLSSCSDRTRQQPRGSVSGPLKFITWQTGGSRGFSWTLKGKVRNIWSYWLAAKPLLGKCICVCVLYWLYTLIYLWAVY